MSGVEKTNSETLKTLWEQKAPKCQRDLIFKKIAITIIALANLAGIALLFTHVCMNYPIPTQALLVSPIIVGILGALSYLKIPTFGINTLNYTHYSNPVLMASRAVTYAVFGPVVLMVRWLDWTNYRDPFVAKQIRNDFETRDCEEVLATYGPRARNLGRYGLLSPELAKEFQSLYTKAKPVLETKKFLENEKAIEVFDAQSLTSIDEQEWAPLKTKIFASESPCFDFPTLQVPDFSKRTTKVKLFIRKYFNLCIF